MFARHLSSFLFCFSFISYSVPFLFSTYGNVILSFTTSGQTATNSIKVPKCSTSKVGQRFSFSSLTLQVQPFWLPPKTHFRKISSLFVSMLQPSLNETHSLSYTPTRNRLIHLTSYCPQRCVANPLPSPTGDVKACDHHEMSFAEVDPVLQTFRDELQSLQVLQRVHFKRLLKVNCKHRGNVIISRCWKGETSRTCVCANWTFKRTQGNLTCGANSVVYSRGLSVLFKNSIHCSNYANKIMFQTRPKNKICMEQFTCRFIVSPLKQHCFTTVLQT